MTFVRLLAIVCVVFAGVRLASAQGPPPPIFPPPGATPPSPAAPPATPVPTPAQNVPPAVPAPLGALDRAASEQQCAPQDPRCSRFALDRAAAEQQCAARDPNCNWFATLGGLERQTMRRALIVRGYELDPEPWGKVVGHIRVYNEDVFAENVRGSKVTRLLRFFNNFHVTSKESVVRDEVILRPGEVWDQNKIEETARRLRDPIFTSVIAVVPVKSSEPGKVDILVVTRDIWSLRLNTQYTYQRGKLTDLATSLSENNFLGRRVLVAAAVTLDQGAIAAGPLFIDKNFLNEHIELRARVNAIVNRDALLQDGRLDSEGSSSTVTLTRTLWNLSKKWGAGLSFSHRFATDRRFLGTEIRPVWCPLGAECVKSGFDPKLIPADELLPWEYAIRTWSTSAYVVRQFGTDFKQQLTLGQSISSVHPSILKTFPGLVEQREPFARAVLPRSEVTSVPYVGYAMYTPKYKTRRNVQTYDLAEDLRIGPSFDASFGVGVKLLGSDNNFWRAAASGAWTIPWCRDGSITLSAGVSTRHQDAEFIDNTASGNLRVVSPTYLFARLVAETTIGTRWNDTANSILTIGSDNGLRGFDINQFSGQRLSGTQIEIRSIPMAIWVFRVGGVLFYDLGGAADSFATMELHHDIGIGLRTLVPQTSRELFRFDLAFPLDGAEQGHPKFIAGFQSEF